MNISSIMSSQLAQLQHTVQLSVLQSSLNMQAVTAVQLIEDMPKSVAQHPYKGTSVDVQA